MKKLIGLIIITAAIFLGGCEYTADYFYTLREIEGIEVLDVSRETVGKTSYNTIIYKDENKKEVELRFYDVDYGFKEYFESAKLFDEKVVVDVVVNKDMHIVSIVLSDREGKDGKK